jgi:hypothetical protein
MGEAKRRGTFEERKAESIERKKSELIKYDREDDIRDAKRGRFYPNGRINPTLMAMYLSALAQKNQYPCGWITEAKGECDDRERVL